MYCSECGKKNPDAAKFCAYCGAKLLTGPEIEDTLDAAPEWDAESRFDKPAAANVWAKPAEPETTDAADPIAVEPVAALKHSAAPQKPAVMHRQSPAPDGVVRANHARPAAQSQWAKPDNTARARQAARSGAPSTIVPVHGRDDEPVNDLFFDGYDAAPVQRRQPARRKQKKPSFFEQNLRGIIGVGLTLGTLLIIAVWLFILPSGQQMLARFGLTDNPAAYANVAASAYDAQNYSTAAQNYYQALLLDDDNYEYALRTAQCYQQAGNTGAASTALTMAIDIDASDVRAYRLLQQLYPDAQTRPTAVSELLSQGATLTGDATLTQ